MSIYTPIFTFDMLIKCHWGDCKELFDSEDDRFTHLKEIHVTKSTTRCLWGQCHYIGNERWNIISHTLTHLNIVTEICYVCNKSFKRRNEYIAHCKRHSENEMRLSQAARLLFEKKDEK